MMRTMTTDHEGVSRTVPDPQVEPTVSVARAAAILGLSRAAAYDAVHNGQIPAFRVGDRWLVPTAKLRAMLGVDGQAAA